LDRADRRFLDLVEGVLVAPYPKLTEIAKLAVYFRVFTLGLWSHTEGLTYFSEALDLVQGSPNLGISVMNPPVTDRTSPPALTEEDRQRAKAAWQAAGKVPERIHIHDLFLSETLGLEPFKSYGGCAAGQSLAHLKGDGHLVACRTLPLPLGDLNVSALTEVWAAPERGAAREEIEAIPHECGGCEHVEVCRGGCPGLATGAGKADRSCLRAKN
jgi:radical SAM protein with 4Fe4S-binding SPASM domain